MANFRPERVREARLYLGLTQEDLGGKLGVTGHAVANWETGRTKQMRLLNLVALVKLTGKPAAWFVGETS